MKSMHSIFAGLFLLLFGARTNAQEKEFSPRLDSFITSILNQVPEVPGMSVAIVAGDKPVFLKAYGYSDKEAGVRCKTNTVFYIASTTKSFTALAAAMLDKEGKIKLDEPIKTYFSSVNFKNNIPADKVTMKSLLTHTSGLSNGYLTFRYAYSGDIDKPDMQKVFADMTTANNDYGKYKYDNLGYNIYTIAVEDKLQTSWQSLLQEKIFKPLGMKRTTGYMSLVTRNKWEYAKPYSAFGKNGVEKLYLEKKDNTMQSAGGLVSTAEDLAIWLEAQINNGMVDGKQIIPADLIEKCRQAYTITGRDRDPFPGDGEYGLGWHIGKWKNEKVVYHFGGFPGYHTHISYLPGSKIGIAVLVNESSVGTRIAELIAMYSYDYWLKEKGMDTAYASKVKTFVEAKEKGKERVQKGYEDRAKRTSQLSMPLENYTGKYQHPYLGTMEITIQDNALAAKIGNLHCVSTAYTKPESIRVEMLPGSGTAIYFKKNDTGEINSIVYEEDEFVKIK